MDYEIEKTNPGSTTVKNYETSVARTNTLIRSVYIWMCTALLLTGATASLVAKQESLIHTIASNRILFWVLLIAQFGLVLAISARVTRFKLGTLSFMFMLYSVLTGVTFSFYFYLFTESSIASTFLVTAGTFGVTSLYGYLTKSDLTKWGNIFITALFGLIIASVVNFFMYNETLYWIVTYAGVLIFVGLIAYDTQKIKALAALEENEHTQKLAIVGALSLYLDFINLFIMLLRILGQRK